MEERRVYRYNFVNFMTGKVDSSLSFASQYDLKIVEEGKEYFYSYTPDFLAGYHGRANCISNQPSFYGSVFAKWSFLPQCMKIHHVLQMYPGAKDSFIKEKIGPESELNHLDSWVENFKNVPKEVILQLYKELEYCFKEMKHVKTYYRRIKSIVSSDIYQIDEYVIDSKWYVSLGRISGFISEPLSYFLYNIKKFDVVKKEKKEFKEAVEKLKKEHARYNIPDTIISALLKASDGNEKICAYILKDVTSTHELFSKCEVGQVEGYYGHCLNSDDYLIKQEGFHYFIKGWDTISGVFGFFSTAVKNELADYMLGK